MHQLACCAARLHREEHQRADRVDRQRQLLGEGAAVEHCDVDQRERASFPAWHRIAVFVAQQPARRRRRRSSSSSSPGRRRHREQGVAEARHCVPHRQRQSAPPDDPYRGNRDGREDRLHDIGGENARAHQPHRAERADEPAKQDATRLSYIECEAPAVATNACHVPQPKRAMDTSTSVAAEAAAARNARQCPPMPSANGTSSAKCGL